jgi:hypothetical protein
MQNLTSTVRASLASPAECRPVLGKAATALFFWYFFNKEKVHVQIEHAIVPLHRTCVEEDFDTTSAPLNPSPPQLLNSFTHMFQIPPYPSLPLTIHSTFPNFMPFPTACW